MSQKVHYQSQGRILAFDSPHVMAILNVTPDSFYDGGAHLDASKLKSHISRLLEEGADSIDIGGVSSRPGALAVGVEEEWQRIEPAIKIALDLGAVVSVDTTQSEIASRAIGLGAHIINDISGGVLDAQILDVVSSKDVVYIAMHMQGTPQTMQNDPQYQSVTLDILNYFARRIRVFSEKGINQVILDPGFGFGKTLEQNYQLFNGLSVFNALELPIMLGVSRKSMIYKLDDSGPKNALPGSLGLAMLALNQGVKLLRVHDVKETIQVVKVFNQLMSNV